MTCAYMRRETELLFPREETYAAATTQATRFGPALNRIGDTSFRLGRRSRNEALRGRIYEAGVTGVAPSTWQVSGESWAHLHVAS